MHPILCKIADFVAVEDIFPFLEQGALCLAAIAVQLSTTVVSGI